MLYWLDGAGSTSEAPNENFAARCMELFTLGRAGGRTPRPTCAPARRAFAGWWVDGDNDDEVQLRSRGLRCRRSVSLLGASPVRRDAVDDVVDAVCDHPACAPFVADKITCAS